MKDGLKNYYYYYCLKLMNIVICCTYYIFCRHNKDWTDPNLMDF